jgi:AcrR family transcriptional regulator
MAGRKPDPSKRTQILRAATEIFSSREFHTVPVDDIAAAAGVGKGTLYLYFPNKEQLFYASILDALDVLLGELTEATRDRRGEDALAAFVGGMLGFFWRRRQLVVLMHRYEHKLREPEGVDWRARRAAILALARTTIRPLHRGLPAADAALATEMLMALIRAAILNHQERDRPERVTRLVTDVFLNGVAGGRVQREPRALRSRSAGVRA